MSNLKVLFVGGSGQISFDCIHESVRQGHETWVFNRGNHNSGLPAEVSHLKGDFHNEDDYRNLLAQSFDVICQFRVFEPSEMQRDLALLTAKAAKAHYIFISSAVCYTKPSEDFPIVESSSKGNLYWDYGSKKLQCEQLLRQQKALPYTIIRPSHTTRDRFITALDEGDLVYQRLQAGKDLILFDSGESLWTITLGRHFAIPFVRLFTSEGVHFEDFHLTSDNAYSWNEIYASLGRVLGKLPNIAYFPVEKIIKSAPHLKGPLLGDKVSPTVFDNTKIKHAVGPFDCDVSLDAFTREVLEKAAGRLGDTSLQESDSAYEALITKLKT
jgi:nucleoside-diphosphate-sugar epimerase